MSEDTNWVETEAKFVYDSKAAHLSLPSVQNAEDKQLTWQISVAETITDRYAKALQELAK
jgi:hypothetical protein